MPSGMHYSSSATNRECGFLGNIGIGLHRWNNRSQYRRHNQGHYKYGYLCAFLRYIRFRNVYTEHRHA